MTDVVLPKDFTGLYIASPVFYGQVSEIFYRSAMLTTADLHRLGVRHYFTTLTSPYIHLGRNILVESFLDSDYSHMLFIDTDTGYATGDVLSSLKMATHHGIVLGPYLRKESEKRWTVSFNHDERKVPACPECGAIELKFGGMGFALIAREVFETMRSNEFRPYDFLHKTSHALGIDYSKMYYWYEKDEGNIFIGEDVYFCRFAQECGYKVWMNPHIKLVHVGQMMWQGDPMDMFEKPKEPTPLECCAEHPNV